MKSPKLSKRKETEIRPFCMYMIVRVQPPAVLCKVYYLFLFILTMVFGDTNYLISMTIPYAFLVSINKILLRLNTELTRT